MNDFLIIPLTQGYLSLVDLEDADLSSYRWHYLDGYARHSKWMDNRVAKFPLHRVIAERILKRPLIAGEVVDHIDGNTLDNRRFNLRVGSQHQNSMNQVRPKNNTSGYKGVVALRGKWQAQIKFNRKLIYAGIYDTPIEAARAYDARSIELFGEYAKLNFPLNEGAEKVTDAGAR